MPGGRRAPIDRALREYARVRRQLGPGRAISFDEAVHVAQRLSRRDFLRLGGLAGAGAVLAACDRGGSPGPEASPRPSNPRAGGRGLPRVVIVGAGLAGMTAAYRLHQAGIRPSVFEARDRVGGRCWSARDWDGGQVAEHGGEFVDTRHVHMRVLVEELGLELDDLWSAWVPGSTWLSYVDGEIVKARDEFRLMAPAIDEVVALAATGPLEAGTSPPEIAAFDEMSAADWYRGAVGSASSGLYRLWTQRLAGWYGLDPAQLGAGNLIDFYAIDYPGGDERYTVRGGNDQVPARILEGLPEGTVTFEAPLESVRTMSGGSVELRFGGVVAPVVADRVILAVPFTTLRRVDLDDSGFSEPMRGAIDDLGMGTNAKVLLQFDRPFYTGFGDWSGGMNRGDEPILGTWESGATDGAKALGLLTVYSGGHVGAGYDADLPHGPAGQDGRRHPGGHRPGGSRRRRCVQRSGVARCLGSGPVGGRFLRRVPAGPTHPIQGCHGRAPGRRAHRRGADLDVQPGIPERRRRERKQGGCRGARGARIAAAQRARSVEPARAPVPTRVPVAGLSAEVPGPKSRLVGAAPGVASVG